MLSDTLLNRIDLVDVVNQSVKITTRDNKSWRGMCPIHNGDNDTSLRVTPTNYLCFSCGARGNVINWVMEREGVDYFTACEILAEEFNIALDEKYVAQKSVIQEKEAKLKQFRAKVIVVEQYLKEKRGLNDCTILEFQLGFEEPQQLIIPVRDDNNRLVAFVRRKLDGSKPKYVNEKNSDIYEKGSLLFGMWLAKKRIINSVYLVEGYLDVMSAHEQGLPALAYCGSEPTKDHIIKLRDIAKEAGFTVYLATDNDMDGQSKIPRIREKFKQYAPNINVRVVKFPDGYKDFNDVHYGHKSIADLETENIDIFCLRKQLENCTERDQEYTLVQEYVKTVLNPMVRGDIVIMLAQRWGADRLQEIKEFVKGGQTDDELFAEFKLPSDAIQEYRESLSMGICNLGFPTLDFSLNHVRKTEVLVIPAYSGVGKTITACEIAMHTALREKKNVVFFSLEMSAGQLIERMIANFLGITTKEAERMVINGDETVMQIYEALQKRMYIVDRASLSMEQVEERIAFANLRLFETPVDVVIIDYLQYMKNTGNYEELANTAKAMKPLAKKFNILLIVLCQLNRQGNQWRKPLLSDIRGAGDIEATADIILALWLPGKDPTMSPSEQQQLIDTIRMGLLKARRGCTIEEVDTIFDKTKMRVRE